MLVVLVSSSTLTRNMRVKSLENSELNRVTNDSRTQKAKKKRREEIEAEKECKQTTLTANGKNTDEQLPKRKIILFYFG